MTKPEMPDRTRLMMKLELVLDECLNADGEVIGYCASTSDNDYPTNFVGVNGRIRRTPDAALRCWLDELNDAGGVVAVLHAAEVEAGDARPGESGATSQGRQPQIRRMRAIMESGGWLLKGERERRHAPGDRGAGRGGERAEGVR